MAKDTVSAWLAAAYHMLKQDNEANKLIEPVINQLVAARPAQWTYDAYSDPLIKDSTMLYVIARHFLFSSRKFQTVYWNVSCKI